MCGGEKMNSTTDKYFKRVEEMVQYIPPLEERKKEIEVINEEYYKETGDFLPNFILEMLGTWLLQEVYSDKRTNKVAVDEFPVLSENQMLRRKRKTVHIDNEYVLETLNFHLRNNSSISKRHEVPENVERGITNEN